MKNHTIQRIRKRLCSAPIIIIITTTLYRSILFRALSFSASHSTSSIFNFLNKWKVHLVNFHKHTKNHYDSYYIIIIHCSVCVRARVRVCVHACVCVCVCACMYCADLFSSNKCSNVFKDGGIEFFFSSKHLLRDEHFPAK